MRPIEEHLKDYARTMIKDLGKSHGRSYLLGCIPIWKKEYGDAVTKKVVAEIKKILSEAKG